MNIIVLNINKINYKFSYFPCMQRSVSAVYVCVCNCTCVKANNYTNAQCHGKQIKLINSQYFQISFIPHSSQPFNLSYYNEM